MNGQERRERIIAYISESKVPVSGTGLTELFHVSRQVIVQEFMDDMKSGKSSPPKNITSNDHAHLVEAEDEKILDLVEEKLREKGFLVQ